MSEVLFKYLVSLVAADPDLGLSLLTGHRWDGVWKILELSAEAGCSNPSHAETLFFDTPFEQGYSGLGPGKPMAVCRASDLLSVGW